MKKFNSEHYTFKYLININCLIKPPEIKIDSFLAPKRKRLKKHLVIYFKKISISIKLLKKLLEFPNIFISILEYVKKCKNNIEKIIHCELQFSTVKCGILEN